MLLPLAQTLVNSQSSPFLTPFGTQKNLGFSSEILSAPVIIVFLVLIIVAIILLATFWPAPDRERAKRQRSYARVDDIYFPVQGIVISSEKVKDFRAKFGHNQASSAPLRSYLEGFLPVDFRLTSLSLGGCALKSDRPLEKGDLVVLKFYMLPDYPDDTQIVSCRVTWIRPPKYPEKDVRYGAGLQFDDLTGDHNKSELRKYLNYLLDEPAA